jgi:hypothetical protein
VNPSDTETVAPPRTDREAAHKIKQRRRLLYGFALVALVVIGVFAVRTFFSGDDDAVKVRPKAAAPLIVERFKLLPVAGASGRGIAELVERKTGDGLRVLAVKLKPNLDGQVYQLLLAGGGLPEKLLGNEVVGQQKTFVGEAKVTADELHKYTRIELRNVTQSDEPVSKLVLRGRIPR